jgi:hypothetical protein
MPPASPIFSPLIAKPCAKVFTDTVTTDTGILTYKAIQTLGHSDTVSIVATDVAGNETERSITVSVKTLADRLIVVLSILPKMT